MPCVSTTSRDRHRSRRRPGRAHALLFAKHGAGWWSTTSAAAPMAKAPVPRRRTEVVAEIRAAGGTAVAQPRLGHGRRQDRGERAGRLRSASTWWSTMPASCVTRPSTRWRTPTGTWSTRCMSKAPTRSLAPPGLHLREQAYGRVVFTSSTSGIYGNFGQSNYGMAKLGLYGLTRTPGPGRAQEQYPGQRHRPHRRYADDRGLIPPQVFEQLEPELVSPLVVYLSSSACEDTSGSTRSAVAGSARYAGNAAWASASIRRPASTPGRGRALAADLRLRERRAPGGQRRGAP